jgi:hypothetical protein
MNAGGLEPRSFKRITEHRITPPYPPNKNPSLDAPPRLPHTPSMSTALLSNGGPPLDDDDSYTPPWGKNGIGRYFEWAHAKKQAFDAPFDVAKLRAQRAALIGLTYDEYVLEILERGRHLNASDTERIAQIVAKRGVRY